MPLVDPSRLKLPAAALAGLFIVGACLADPAAPSPEPTATPGPTEVASNADEGTPVPNDTPPPTPAPTIRPRRWCGICWIRPRI